MSLPRLVYKLALLTLTISASESSVVIPFGHRPTPASADPTDTDDLLDFYITGPERYTALSADMDIYFSVPPTNSEALLARVVDRSGKASSTAIPPFTPSGRVIIPCGMVHRAGNYTFELILRSNETVMARSRRDTVVEWPSVKIHVPYLIETHSSDASVYFELPEMKCPPFHKEDYSFRVDLEYVGDGANSSWQQVINLESQKASSWRDLTEHEITFSCRNFDRPGYYQVSLHCDDCETLLSEVARSLSIQAKWSGQYSISVAQKFIGQCLDGINVAYHYPPCSGSQDRLRIYGLSEATGTETYIMEKRLYKERHAINLGCHHFDGPFSKFCFHYVSTAHNGAVHSVEVHCRPVKDDSSQYGEWDEWTPWTFCSGGCGRGSQMRHRSCSKKKCRGERIESRECDLPDKCPSSSTTLPPDVDLGQVARYCACGCVLGVFKNTTVYFKADECARNGSHALWILRPVFHNASSIIVRLSSARLGEPDSNYLVVRDGVNAGGDMLVTLTGGDESSRLPLELRSPSGPLRIEFVYGTAAPGKDVDVLMSFYEELIPRGVTALAQIGLLHRIRQLPQLHLVALIVVGSLLIVSGTLCLVHRVALAKVITKQRRPSVFSIPPGNVEGQSPTDLLLSGDSLETVLSPSPPPTPTPTAASVEIHRVPSRATVTPVASQPQNGLQPPSSTGESPLKKKASVLASLESLADLTGLARRKLRKRNTKLQRHSVMCTSSEFGSTSGTDGFEFDAYDYGCEDIPNSFFNSTAVVLPPFLSERDLCMFKLPPSTVEHIEVQDLTDSAETLAPLENKAPVTVLQ
ncbi:uncharacterized protein LOC111266355 [Varroa jacobsoni]|nr:uncharacterized protein LOC111266355 [Varroa jacobsoni]